jgi:DnaJ homolog subfamily C member 28
MSQDKHQPSRLVFKLHTKAAPKVEPQPSEEERLRAAREKAAEYRNPQPPTEETGDGVRSMEEWADLVTNRIEEAMRRGDFDQLPGRGKPLHVEHDPFVPEGQQMAFRLLKNNDLVPSWIAERNEILRAVELWREQFQRIVSEAHSAWVAASSDKRRVQIRENWARWLARWEDEVREMNRRINTLNLQQPITHLEVFKLNLDNELRKVGMARTLDR